MKKSNPCAHKKTQYANADVYDGDTNPNMEGLSAKIATATNLD